MHNTGLQMKEPWAPRYHLLDACRGLAALVVVFHHTGSGVLGFDAVMVFFVISGYCITATAHSGIRRKSGMREFMWRRLRRIYPPYFFALLFFLATRVAKLVMTGQNDLARSPLVYLQNFTLTQWLSPFWGEPYTQTVFVAAFWSLCFEEQFYIVMAAFIVLAIRYQKPLVMFVLPMTALSVAWNLLLPHSGSGLFIQFWFHFAVGSILYYQLVVYRGRPAGLVLDVAMVLAAVVAWAVIPLLFHDLVAEGPLYQWRVVLLFGLALRVARPIDETFKAMRITRPLMALGLISYSLYLIHQFNSTLALSVSARLLPSGVPHVMVVLGAVTFHLVLATGFWWLCERPFLNKPRPPIEPDADKAEASSGQAQATAAPA